MILGLITHPSVWTKFHGNPSFLLCFFSSLDHFFFFFLFLFSLVIWEGNVLKDMVSLHLGFSPFFQVSTICLLVPLSHYLSLSFLFWFVCVWGLWREVIHLLDSLHQCSSVIAEFSEEVEGNRECF